MGSFVGVFYLVDSLENQLGNSLCLMSICSLSMGFQGNNSDGWSVLDLEIFAIGENLRYGVALTNLRGGILMELAEAIGKFSTRIPLNKEKVVPQVLADFNLLVSMIFLVEKWGVFPLFLIVMNRTMGLLAPLELRIAILWSCLRNTFCCLMDLGVKV